MNFHDFKVKDIKGQEVSLKDYQGKMVMVVNTASKCGFTPQYEGLEKLYKKYKDRGFVVLGFPCNQFLSQEPDSEEEIASFCQINFGVTFPLFSKVDVNGENAAPLFKFLTEAAPFIDFEMDKTAGIKIKEVVEKYYPENLEGNSVKWNFTKFLIERDGTVKARFEPSVTPEELDDAIAAAL